MTRTYLRYDRRKDLSFIALNRRSVYKLLKYYENKRPPEYVLYFNGNLNNFVKLVKFNR